MSDRLANLRSSEEFAEERLVVHAQALLYECMVARGYSYADLARKMGVSKARVSQIFSDHQNFTLRLLAKAFFAVGEEIQLARKDAQIETKSMPIENQDQMSLDVLIKEMAEISHGFEWTDGSVITGAADIPSFRQDRNRTRGLAAQMRRIASDGQSTEARREHDADLDQWLRHRSNVVVPFTRDKKVLVNG